MPQATKQPPYSYARNYLESKSQSVDTGIYPYLHILRNRKEILVGSIFFALGIAFFANVTQKPVYQATAELILQSKDSTKALSSGPMTIPLFQDPTLLLTQFRMIRGPHLAEKTLEKIEKPENRQALLDSFGIRPSRKKKSPGVFSDKERRALIGAIQGSITPRQLDRTVRIISLSVTGYDPPTVAKVANAAAEAYVEVNYKSNMDSFRQSFSMISKSLAEIREKIKTGEIAFQKIDSEIKLLEALKIYEEKHPLVIQLRTEIPQLAEKLSREIQIENLQVGQRKDLVPLLTVPTVGFEDLLKIENDLYTLKPILEQEVNTNKEMYNSIFRRLQEVEVSGGGNVWIDAEIAELAGVPGRPIRPNKKMNLLIGLLMGLFLGTSLAFFLEYLDSTVRSLQDVEGYLKLFPLGMVPRVELPETESPPGEKEGAGVGAKHHRRFWLAGDSDIPLYVAEAYRIIRTNLAFGSVDTSLKVLQVTSAVKGEGKTTTAANLAVSLALAGSRTLLVDADLRRPALHRILGMDERGPGLSEALTNGKPADSLLVATVVPNLFCLVAGTIPPNPSELLSSKRMKALVDEIRENFDMVILDSPPVISVADSAIIASRVDGTIFVSRSGFVPRHLCLQAKHALESVNGKIIGCVLNSVQSGHQPYHYDRYYREYARYGDQKGASAQPDVSQKLTSQWERFKALKEPLLIFLSSSWSRLGERLKWDQSKKESKTSLGARE